MSVDWAIVSAVTSIVGVFGGLVSVVALVFEIRRNSRAVEGATVQALMAFEVSVQETTLNHADVYSRALKSTADLSDEDKLRFDLLVGIKIAYCYSGFIQYQKGLIDDDMWEAYRAAVRAWVANQNTRASWLEHLAWYPEGFQKVAHEILASVQISPAS